MGKKYDRPSNFKEFDVGPKRSNFNKHYNEDEEDKQLFPKPVVFAIALPSSALPFLALTLVQVIAPVFGGEVVFPSTFSAAAIMIVLVTLLVYLVFGLVKKALAARIVVAVLSALLVIFTSFITATTYLEEIKNGVEYQHVLSNMSLLVNSLYPAALIPLFIAFEKNNVVLSFLPLIITVLLGGLGCAYALLGQYGSFFVTWLLFIACIAGVIGLVYYTYHDYKMKKITDNEIYRENRRRNLEALEDEDDDY